jgi:hypothetical protein
LEPSFACLRAIVECERAKRGGGAVDAGVEAQAESCRSARMKDRARSILASFQLSAAPSGD